MHFAPSPFEKYNLHEKTLYIKRDDLLDTHFSGNKARKFHYFLHHEFTDIKRVVSYGSNQSNAMYSLSVLAHMKGWEFIYFCDHIPSFLKENPMGNYLHALQNGMKIFETAKRYEDAHGYASKDTLMIEEGGRQREAEWGIMHLAKELTHDIHTADIKNPYIFLPSGTGTTALYLQKHLNIPVITCCCVANARYLEEQWEMMGEKRCFFPQIVQSAKKYHYGKLYPELYAQWKEVQDCIGVTFDLVYDPVGLKTLMEHLPSLDGTPIYIHQGGILGNVSMLERYKRKSNML